MKKINKLTLHKIDVEPSEILRKNGLKHILGGGYGLCVIICHFGNGYNHTVTVPYGKCDFDRCPSGWVSVSCNGCGDY